MRIIKVLHYGLSYNKGGVENVVHSWFNNLPEDIHFDFLNDSNLPIAYEEEYIQKGCKVYKISDRYSNPIKHYKELKKIIIDNDYDFFHFHIENLTEAEPAIVSNLSNKCLCIYHTHSLHAKDTIKEKILMCSAKMLLFGKEYMEFACGNEIGEGVFHNNKFKVIENGIDLNRYRYSSYNRKKIRQDYKINDNEFVVGHIGRFGPEKNYPFIIETLSLLVKEFSNIKLMLIGNMNEHKEMHELISKYDLKKFVCLTGVVDDTSKYYSAMDLFFLPSLEEGISVSMIEAQTSGLPVVASNVISKEVKISDNVEFINLDVKKAADVIGEHVNAIVDRNNVCIDNKYDIYTSSNKLFNIYREKMRTNKNEN